MDRFQTVNGGKDTMHPFGASELLKPPPEVVEAAERARAGGLGRLPGGVVARRSGPAAVRPGTAEAVNYGPCLYFGPRGERCERRANATGFCQRHKPKSREFERAQLGEEIASDLATEGMQDVGGDDSNADSVKRRSRILIALLGLVGVLWPILNEMLRALISFLHRK